MVQHSNVVQVRNLPETPPSLRDKLHLRDDGRMLVSRTHHFAPEVQAFQERVRRLGINIDVKLVDLATIQAANDNDGGDSKRNNSDIQEYAKELFKKAVLLGASDIHFRESVERNFEVYFRIDGDLEFQEEHPREFGQQVCTSIYGAMADVADATYQPSSYQDARISDREKIPDSVDGIRIGTGPQVDGSVMVLRLLYNNADQSLDLRVLGFEDHHVKTVDAMKRMPTGINIIAGPTGGGKSTTLHRVLSAIQVDAKGRKNIMTVEDPPEYPIPGVVQMPVSNADTEEERSDAFQRAISGSMRLDPDVLMIGEIRDFPSAKLAIRAAMTGHQVWTSLHANGAFAVLTRLIDLGVPIDMVCDPEIITGLTFQRLLKRLCTNCRKPLQEVVGRYSNEQLERVMIVAPIETTYVTGPGCNCCRNTGTNGRTVVAEAVVTNAEIMQLVKAGNIAAAKEYWLDHMHGETIADHAIRKVRAGLVDPFHAEEKVGALIPRAKSLT